MTGNEKLGVASVAFTARSVVRLLLGSPPAPVTKFPSMEVQPLTDAQGPVIAAWRYPDRYSTYDVGEIVTAAAGYWAVVGEGEELVGYCCLGREARVPGVEDEEGTLDIGYSMHPDYVGKGLGRVFVTTVVDFAVDKYRPQQLRLLILSWNERSRRVAEALGFENTGIARSGDRNFLVMTRPASGSPEGD